MAYRRNDVVRAFYGNDEAEEPSLPQEAAPSCEDLHGDTHDPREREQVRHKKP